MKDKKTNQVRLDLCFSINITELAEEVLEGKEEGNRWLHRPQSGLGERTPLELMKNEVGAREVEELLYRIEYGIYS